MKNSPKIFIVEDDVFYATLLEKQLLENQLDNVEVYCTGEECLDNLYKMPNVVLLDYDLGSSNGIDVLKNIKSVNPNIEVIFLSGQEKMNVAITSLKYGAYDYIEKNKTAFKRVKSLINKIGNNNNVIKERKQLKMIKSGVVVILILIITISVYFQFFHF